MENIVKKFIKDNKLNINNKVICAVSGGADSVSLIYILNKLGYDTILAHVNHHKRIESEMEEKEMKEFAKSLNVPFELLNYHYDGVDNFHNDSHNKRYDFFRDLCDKYNTNIIATAHHLDDELETILIKLMEGSNLYGYGGISICNNDGKYRIIRPLLCVSKEEIYNYCKINNLKYFEDSSNHEDVFLRNRLRHHVIPLLKNECSDIYSKTLRYNKLLHESFDYIRENSINYLKENNNIINVETYNKLHIALKKDILSYMLENLDIRKNTKILDSILDILNDNLGNKEIRLENDYIFIKSYNEAYIKKIVTNNNDKMILDINNEVIFENKYKFYFSKNMPSNNAKYIKLCYNQLELPFIIRHKENGDLINIKDGTKKVSRILIDKKVSKYDRMTLPIVLDNHNNVIWVYDYIKSYDIYKYINDSDIYLVCEVLSGKGY